MKAKYIFIITALVAVVVACQKETNGPPIVTEALILPDELYDYAGYELPSYFTSDFLDLVGYTPADNPTTNEGATLGRVLFYDTQLSANKTISCSSCHLQEKGFTDGVAFSEGFDGGHTGRNSMHLVNLQFNRRMFWDTRASNLETQVLLPIQDPIEMGLELDDLLIRLESSPYYPELFDAAFGTPEITTDRVSKALAQFVRAIVSYETKYDVGKQSDYQNFSEQELLGKELFYNGETRCNLCHLSDNFFLTSPMNNGLDIEYEDGGQFNLTGNIADHGQFKVPSLRNCEVTGPYMHDGRFNTLMEVVEHYNSGIQAHPYLDDQLAENVQIGGPPVQLNLSQEEKEALVAFMKTLTDYELLTDPKYSNPFVQIIE